MFILMKTPRASLTVTKPCIIHSEVQVDSTAEGKNPLNVFSNIPGKGNGRCEEKGHGRREKQKNTICTTTMFLLSKFSNTNALMG